MSFYATLQGFINYPDTESFDAMKKKLVDGGWVENDKFVDECGDIVLDSGQPDLDRETKSITVPLACYHNLSRVKLFTNGAKGKLVGASTDGCFEGWVITDGNEETYDLDEWAEENIDEPKPDLSVSTDDDQDEDDKYEAFADWRELVIQEFQFDH